MRFTRHQITRPTREGPGDFQPFFTFDAPADEPYKGGEGPREMLRDACRRWVEGGGLIVRIAWGVTSVNCRRACGGRCGPKDPACPHPLSAEYGPVERSPKYTSPFGALLMGRPSSFAPHVDAARLLGVDEFWAVGFLHGLDGTTGTTVGRMLDKFEKSPSYKDGRDAGQEIAAEFVRIPGGWEAVRRD